jgi:hypothetical protein
MLELDLQDYLFENPDVLFPNQTVRQKRREVYIEGRRIDLLFDVDGTQYIVELKRDTIKREDIGQVFEYYGLMRHSKPTASFRMVLVAPSIPEYRRIPLEEMGIRCVEVKCPPTSAQERLTLQEVLAKQQKKQGPESPEAVLPLHLEQLKFEDLLPPVTAQSMQISRSLLEDSLPGVQKHFSEFELRPVKMVKPNQPDVLCIPTGADGAQYRLVGAGAWWAYSFGHSDSMPKNDVPNISVNALPWGLVFALNAELQTSQKVMRDRIATAPRRFDQLVAEHGLLRLQAWLKFEFQPRLYYWILLPEFQPRYWGSSDLLNLYQQSVSNFPSLRTRWVARIKEMSGRLSAAQIAHLDSTNKNLNLALRLVYSFEKSNDIWTMPYDQQRLRFDSEYQKLKPLIQFFQ